MRRAGARLNLREHLVRDTLIVGPGDIEGHQGTDGRFYLIDFGRVMPPEAPLKGRNRSIFYNLLRPALVQKFNGTPPLHPGVHASLI